MTAVAIPDLWSEDIKVDVTTPLAILRAQETALSRKTKGVLQAKVVTSVIDGMHQKHVLNVIAPSLNGYSVTLLEASHGTPHVYPVTIASDAFSSLHLRTLGDGAADTQEDFVDQLRNVLQSSYVKSLLQSLIASSNEVIQKS